MGSTLMGSGTEENLACSTTTAAPALGDYAASDFQMMSDAAQQYSHPEGQPFKQGRARSAAGGVRRQRSRSIGRAEQVPHQYMRMPGDSSGAALVGHGHNYATGVNQCLPAWDGAAALPRVAYHSGQAYAPMPDAGYPFAYEVAAGAIPPFGHPAGAPVQAHVAAAYPEQSPWPSTPAVLYPAPWQAQLLASATLAATFDPAADLSLAARQCAGISPCMGALIVATMQRALWSNQTSSAATHCHPTPLPQAAAALVVQPQQPAQSEASSTGWSTTEAPPHAGACGEEEVCQQRDKRGRKRPAHESHDVDPVPGFRRWHPEGMVQGACFPGEELPKRRRSEF